MFSGKSTKNQSIIYNYIKICSHLYVKVLTKTITMLLSNIIMIFNLISRLYILIYKLYVFFCFVSEYMRSKINLSFTELSKQDPIITTMKTGRDVCGD